MTRRTDLSRRELLRGAAAGAAWMGAAAGFPVAIQSLLASQANAGRIRSLDVANPYGDPVPTPDQTTGLPLLRLPPGFTYRTFAWTGDPMLDGTPCPGNPDGMAVVHVEDNRSRDLVLIRNHELTFGELIGRGALPFYDDLDIGLGPIAGGTTALVFRRGEWVSAEPTLGGTVGNCAGGPTPWGSWLTCEETVSDGRHLGGRLHGFIFEVPAPSLGRATAVPITDMGLFRHEAVAIDPRTGFAYETEDNAPNSGFYRFRPNQPAGGLGSLEAGGALDMLSVVGAPGADLRTALVGSVFDVDWVPVADPDFLPPEAVGKILFTGPSGPYRQGAAGGGARFARLEGCWYANGSVWFVDTTGGVPGQGAVWRYDPPETLGTPGGPGRLTAIYVAEGLPNGDNPDNITVSPRGGLVLCEDHLSVAGTRLLGMTPEGVAFPFAQNDVVLAAPPAGKPDVLPADYRGSEFAGACFDPTGRWLFANLYKPGFTFAITGPWARGPL
jgi:secreted PhoX family phosphatase